MPDSLIACAIEIPEPILREETARRLRAVKRPPLLVLNTCQRLEVYGRRMPTEIPASALRVETGRHEALRRLARIAAGLESRILGELEILGQVREAYRAFSESFAAEDSRLDRLFQDAIALARKARRESGIDQNLTGLAALTARRIIDSVPADTPVAIVGSGSLASGVARYLGKRSRLPLRISSRCPENALRLAYEVGGFAVALNELAPLLHDAPVIVTATAAPHPVVFDHHLPVMSFRRLILDLGEPPDCASELRNRADIDYVGLLDIEAQSHSNTAERQRRAERAAAIIDEATSR